LKVGNTGNAKGKYSIASFFPQGDWRWEPKQVAIFINPIKEMEN
jgi:hypothetical protein